MSGRTLLLVRTIILCAGSLSLCDSNSRTANHTSGTVFLATNGKKPPKMLPASACSRTLMLSECVILDWLCEMLSHVGVEPHTKQSECPVQHQT
jgi:hypothetical protein